MGRHAIRVPGATVRGTQPLYRGMFQHVSASDRGLPESRSGGVRVRGGSLPTRAQPAKRYAILAI